MALNSRHPHYIEMRPSWDVVRDVHQGEKHVKNKGETYLPPTRNMRADGYGSSTALTTTMAGRVNLGQEAYEAYRLRAVLPDYVKDAVEVFIGLLHSQPPQIELPTQMEPMRDRITTHGESMELLLRRINVEQLVAGRVGLLLDLPRNPDPASPLPFIALYVAEAGINWDDGQFYEGTSSLNLVVLDESGFVRRDLEWRTVVKHRVLELPVVFEDEETGMVEYGPYRQGVFIGIEGSAGEYSEEAMFEPQLRGTKLNEIPFVFVNTSDIIATPDDPPLLGLANACLTIYRGEADYRQNLFMQGQDTLVIIGDVKRSVDPNELAASSASSEPLRVGAGSVIQIEAAPGADVKYAGVGSGGSGGLTEQRESLANDRERAEAKAGALSSDNATVDAASGEALKTRVAARTASLNQIAKTGAAALEWILKLAAKWMGANPDEVKVTPNLEFADYQMTGDNLNKIMAAKVAGAPLSRESIHRLLAQGGLTEMDYETEKDLLDKEKSELPPPGTNAGGNPPLPGNQPPPKQAPASQPPPPRGKTPAG